MNIGNEDYTTNSSSSTYVSQKKTSSSSSAVMSQDPSIFIMEQVEFYKRCIEALDHKVEEYERNINFHPDEFRYKRWIDEKSGFINNIQQLLLKLNTNNCQTNNVTLNSPNPSSDDWFIDRSGQNGTLSMTHSTSANDSFNLNNTNQINETLQEQFDPNNINNISKNPHGLELNKYTSMKKEQANIMRKFTENKIHFKRKVDNSDLFIQDYHSLGLNTEQLESSIIGELLTFKTAINLKTHQVSETTLFLPYFENGGQKRTKK
eukprot:gene5452-7546_t